MRRWLARLFLAVLLLLFGFALFLLETAQLKLSLLAVLALVLSRFFEGHRKHIRWAALVIAVLCFSSVVWLMPPRRSDPRSRFQSVFLDATGARVSCPWLPYFANLLPESDLIRISTLFSGVFPFPTRGALLDELRDMEAFDNPFVREYRVFRDKDADRLVPSALFLQFLQQQGYYRDVSHFVLILPEQSVAPAPLLIFLHGYMGNFQFYCSYFSDLTNFAVLIPSTKSLSGLWTQRDLDRLLGPIAEEIETSAKLDRDDVHLVGLSNGGSGVNAAAKTRSGAFKSLTFLSTWVDPLPEQFSARKTIAVIYGERDGISANNVKMVHLLRERGFAVTSYPFKRERHFLMLTRKQEVLNAIRATLGKAARHP